MAVDDLWRLKDDTPSRRDGRGKRYRVRVEGYPSTLHRTRKEADLINAERIMAGPPKPASSSCAQGLPGRPHAAQEPKSCVSANRVRGLPSQRRVGGSREGRV